MGDETIFDGDETIFDGDETVYDDKTVYDDESTVSESDETVYDGNETVYEDDKTGSNFKSGDLLLDTYEIRSDAINGGMGSVWRVHHMNWDVDLAMKRPKPELFLKEKQKEDFIRECESWINLGLHPNIVSCYYVRSMDGVPTVFSEWMENKSLEDHIKNESLYEGTKNEVKKRLLNIAIQFARGLNYAHEKNLIHRDVKPDNLLLTNDWDAKVSDFGLAQAVSGISASLGMTPAYCSPEQAAFKPLTIKTDIYSWAVSILEMYLGAKPWAHGKELTGSMVGAVCYEYYEMCRIPVPERLQKLLARCMAQDPEDRYQNFVKVEIALKEIYRMETGEEYDLPHPKAADNTADSLNNKALSYLDLGKPDEARRLWKMALKEDPGNTRALYNYCLHSFREGLISAKEGICYLSANWENYFSKPEPGILLAKFSMEADEWNVAFQVKDYLNEEFSELIDSSYDSDNEYRGSYELSLIRSITDHEKFQKKCNDRLEELEGYLDRGEYADASREMLISRMSGEYGDAVFGLRWLDINDRLSRKCFPMQLIAHWPVAVLEGVEEDAIRFNKSGDLVYGNRTYETCTWEIKTEDQGKEYIEQEDECNEQKDKCNEQIDEYNEQKNESNEQIDEHDEQKNECTDPKVSVSPDGQLSAHVRDDGRIAFSNAYGFLLKEIEITDEAILQIEISFDDERALVLSQRHLYLVYIFEDRSQVLATHPGDIRMTVNTTFTKVILACKTYGFFSIDLDTKESKEHFDPVAMQRGHVIDYPQLACFLPNDQFIMVANREDIYFYDPVNDRVLSVIHTPDYIDEITVSGNGKYIAIKEEEKTYIWECMYAYAPSPTEWSDGLRPYAMIAIHSHPAASVSEVTDILQNELTDRGFGNIPREILLEKVREIHGETDTATVMKPEDLLTTKIGSQPETKHETSTENEQEPKYETQETIDWFLVFDEHKRNILKQLDNRDFAAALNELEKIRELNKKAKNPDLVHEYYELNSKVGAECKIKEVMRCRWKKDIEETDKKRALNALLGNPYGVYKKDKTFVFQKAVPYGQKGRSEELLSLKQGIFEPGIEAGCISDDGTIGITGTKKGLVTIWDLNKKRILYKLKDLKELITAVTISKDNKLAAAADESGSVCIWKLRTGELFKKCKFQEKPAWRIFAFDSFYEYLACGGWKGELGVVSLKEDNEKYYKNLGKEMIISDMTYSVDGERLWTYVRTAGDSKNENAGFGRLFLWSYDLKSKLVRLEPTIEVQQIYLPQDKNDIQIFCGGRYLPRYYPVAPVKKEYLATSKDLIIYEFDYLYEV